MRRNAWRVLTCAAVGAALCLTSAASAQQTAKVGPEHKIFEPLVGKFKATIKLWADPGKPPEESEGTMNRKLILGGMFLQEEFAAKMMGMDFAGIAISGYDVQKKKYVAAWLDNMSGTINSIDASYDPKTKTLTGIFEEVDPATGKKVRMRDAIRILDADHQIQEMFTTPEGSTETKTMEIHYQRVK